MSRAVLHQRLEQQKKDLDLLRRIQGREQQALSLLYDHYSGLLYSLTLKIVQSSEEAEDVLQEVFLLVWDKSRTYESERGSVYLWIVTLCRNKSIDRLRSNGFKKQSREVGLEPLEHQVQSQPESNPYDVVVGKGNREVIVAAMKQLTESQKRMLELSYYEGYSQSEISEKLQMPLGTVKTRTRQALKKLRALVQEGSIR